MGVSLCTESTVSSGRPLFQVRHVSPRGISLTFIVQQGARLHRHPSSSRVYRHAAPPQQQHCFDSITCWGQLISLECFPCLFLDLDQVMMGRLVCRYSRARPAVPFTHVRVSFGNPFDLFVPPEIEVLLCQMQGRAAVFSVISQP